MGIWKLPVYNAGYYQAMSVSIMINFSYLIPLLIAKSKSDTLEQRTIYNHLIFGVVVSVIGHIIFGYFNFEDSLPPYPYLYSGVIWCYFLRHTMKRHDFLNLYDKRYEKLFNMNPDAILLIDRMQTVKDANPRAIQLFRSFELEFAQFFDLLDPIIKERMQAKLEIDHYETDISHNNKLLFLLVNADYVWVDNEQLVLLILRDISVQKRHQEEVKFLAYHDPLTRLPNRRYFHEKLEEALQEAERHNQTLALLLIDLDKIKLLNDTRGHLAGDETLKYAAQIIKEAVEDCGVAARIGGDEFILFIANSPSYEEVERKIGHMQEKFSRYISKYGALPVGMSIGVSRYPTDGVEGQALINIADNAMYEMKRSRA